MGPGSASPVGEQLPALAMPSLAQLPGVLQLPSSLLLPGPPSCSPLAVLMKRKSWWLFLPPQVSICAGWQRTRQRWLVSLEPRSSLPPRELWSWGAKGTGEKHSGAAGQGVAAGAKFHFATSNYGGCAVAIPGRAVGLGLCSNSPSQGMGLLGEEEERLGCISHQRSKIQDTEKKENPGTC